MSRLLNILAAVGVVGVCSAGDVAPQHDARTLSAAQQPTAAIATRPLRPVAPAASTPGTRAVNEPDAAGNGDHSNQDGGCGGVDESVDVIDGKVVVYVWQTANGTETGRSWSNAFTSLQAGITAARTYLSTGVGVEIWLAQGVYTPGDEREATFRMPAGLSVFGGFSGVETERDARNADPYSNGAILSGDLLGNDNGTSTATDENSYHIVTFTSAAGHAVLDGLTIVGGNADGFAEQSTGAGVLVRNGGATFVNCVLADNWARSGGGAIHVCENGSLALTTVDFIANGTDGDGGALLLTDTAAADCFNCRFAFNSAASGGAIKARNVSTLALTNNLLTHNSALAGGAAVLLSDAEMHILNCTVRGNSAVGSGGGLIANASDLHLVNSILWENSADVGAEAFEAQLTALGTGVYDLRYSCVQGWTPVIGGEGNFAANPLLMGPFNSADPLLLFEGLQLAAGSPCIDAGSNADVAPSAYLITDGATGMPTPVDVSESYRFVDDPNTIDTGLGAGALIDIGAYEFDGETLLPSGG